MSKRWKLLVAILAGSLCAGFGLALLDPFFRQLFFGPKFNGTPLVSWQTFFRAWDTQERPAERSVLDNVHDAVVSPPDAQAWKRLSGEDRRAILLTLADDSQELVRLHVAGHLGAVPANSEVVAVLTRYTKEKTGRVRQYAALSLGKIEPAATASVADLLQMLNDPDPLAARAARQALGSLGSKSPESVVPKLIPLLRANDVATKLAALDAVSYLKVGADPAVPPLLEILRDPRWQLRAEALRALGFIKAQRAVPQIIGAINDAETEVRMSAINALGNIGPGAGAAIAELLKLRTSPPSQRIRHAVERALTRIDPVRYPEAEAK